MTRHRSLGAALTLAAAVASLAACGDSTAPLTATLSDAQIAADVAASAGDAIAGDLAEFGSDAGAAGLAANVASAAVSGCPYDAATQTHVCAGVTERGLAVSRSYQFRDASGTPMQSYDGANTASIFFTQSAAGTLSGTTDNGATWSSSVHRSGERTVTGLLGDETQRVWNATGESHDTSDYAGTGGTRHYAGASTETSSDVVLKLPKSSFPYPTSGTMTRAVNFTLTVTGARAATRTISRTVVATFNGTANVPLVVNGVATCSLNLDTGKVSGCARQ